MDSEFAPLTPFPQFRPDAAQAAEPAPPGETCSELPPVQIEALQSEPIQTEPLQIEDAVLDRLRLKLRYKVLYHVGHNCADVDDIVQETLTRFIKAGQRHQIRNTDEFGAFLNGVCRNVILEYRRRVRRDPAVTEDGEIPERGVRPDAEILEMRDAIDNGLAELSDRDRTILRALYLDGKDKDEICRDWNMSDAQFRVVLFRAKERFRRAYNGELKQNAASRH
jgi:RNA polymerase sigma-70 factor (ECF subfamily)